jgi:AraC-like DNA-binding protein
MPVTYKRNPIACPPKATKLITLHFILAAVLLLSACHQSPSDKMDADYTQKLKTASELLNSMPDSATFIYRTVLTDSSNISKIMFNELMFGLAKSLPVNHKGDSALYWAERCSSLALEREDTVLAIKSLLTTGNINSRNLKIRKAMTAYTRGLRLAEAAGLNDMQPGFLIGMGNIQQGQSDFDSAIISFTKAAKAAHLAGQNNIEAIACSNIGQLLAELKDYKEAIRYTTLALELDKEHKNALGYSVYLLNMGNHYKNLKNADSAMKYYNLAEKIYLTANDSLSLIRLMYNRAFVYANTGKMQQAVADIKTVLHYSRQYNSAEGQIYACNALSELMLRNGNTTEALAYADEGIALAFGSGIHSQLPVLYNERSEALKAQGNYPAAFAAIADARRISDSLTNNTRQSEISALKVQFETELKDSEIENLSAELRAESKARRLQLFISILSLLLLAGGAISFVSVFRLLKTRTSAFNALLAIYGGKAPAVIAGNRLANSASTANPEAVDFEISDTSLQEPNTAAPPPTLLNSAHQNIVQLMEKNQVYLDAQLTMEKLARISDTDKKELSLLLRNSFGLGFQQFINKYRVEHAMQMLGKRENDNLKVEYIGLQSGFNSRATFYSIFTSHTGLPPAVYRQGMIDQESKT